MVYLRHEPIFPTALLLILMEANFRAAMDSEGADTRIQGLETQKDVLELVGRRLMLSGSCTSFARSRNP